MGPKTHSPFLGPTGFAWRYARWEARRATKVPMGTGLVPGNRVSRVPKGQIDTVVGSLAAVLQNRHGWPNGHSQMGPNGPCVPGTKVPWGPRNPVVWAESLEAQIGSCPQTPFGPGPKTLRELPPPRGPVVPKGTTRESAAAASCAAGPPPTTRPTLALATLGRWPYPRRAQVSLR